VKVITTTTHTNREVRVADLMTPDPDNPSRRDWRNGQAGVETETEWQLLQIDYNSGDYNPVNGVGGKNGKLAGPAHNLARSDDVVTYRYEFYAYVGPYDDQSEPPTHEALCEMPGPDGVHGTGDWVNTVVVGKFLGAQMSALAGKAPLALVDHLPDAEVGADYAARTVVIASDTNFTATVSDLPDGLVFDAAKAQVYGTPGPLSAGVHIITVTATTTGGPLLVKHYPIVITDGPNETPHSAVDTMGSPQDGGITEGDGVYENGTTATVVARPGQDFRFGGWLEHGAMVSPSAAYTFTNLVNRSLTATFVPAPTLLAAPVPAGLLLAWHTNFTGYSLEQSGDLAAGRWTAVTQPVKPVTNTFQATVPMAPADRQFFRLRRP
jgi:hypothetical protein